MIEVRQFSSAAEMRAHYRALHARLFNPRPKAEKPAIIEIPAESKPLVDRFVEIEIAQPKPAPEPEGEFVPEAGKPGARRIVAHIARKHGVTPEDIYGPRRHAVVMEARFEAVAMVYTMNPAWSLPQLGRFFNRDHTTVLHCLRKQGLRP